MIQAESDKLKTKLVLGKKARPEPYARPWPRVDAESHKMHNGAWLDSRVHLGPEIM